MQVCARSLPPMRHFPPSCLWPKVSLLASDWSMGLWQVPSDAKACFDLTWLKRASVSLEARVWPDHICLVFGNNRRAREGGPGRGEAGVRETSKVYPRPEEAKMFPKTVALKLQRHLWFETLSKLPLDFTVKACSVGAELTWPFDLAAVGN